MLIALLSLAALATSALSALAGIGGGTLLIALLFAAGLAPAVALPLHAGVQLVANGSRSLAYRQYVRWRALGLFLITAVPVPFIVAPWVIGADPDIVRLIMAVFITLAVWPGWASRLRLHGRTGLLAAGAIVGATGVVVGATGLFAAPFFFREAWRKEQVIATLAAAQTCAHALKIAAFWVGGSAVIARPGLLVAMTAAAVAGTLLGRRLLGRVPEPVFRRLFRVLLLVLAAKLAYDGLRGLVGG